MNGPTQILKTTFCPLCNSGITFDRRTADGVLSFGVSGKLRNSDMIMYDRETESWWQQAIGEAIVGDLTGTELTSLPSWMESWDVFAARNPDGLTQEGTVTQDGITLTWVAGQASALDTAQIGAGRDVGNVRVRDAAGNDLPHDVMFAFAFHAFWPDGDWKL